MGVGLRIFVVNDDNSLLPLSLKKYEGLLQRDPEICFPLYADKRVRYAEVTIEFENRRPIDVLRMEYFIMHFDSKGRLKDTAKNNKKLLGVNLVPAISLKNDPVVIDAQHLFAKKRFDHQFRWRPTPEIKTAILKAVFKT